MFKKERNIPRVLRSVSFFLLLWFIFEPLFEFILSQRPWLLVLLDTSKSMAVGERLESAQKILSKVTCRYRVYGFDAYPYPVKDSLYAAGDETNITNAFLETPKPSAYLLLSDGIHNSGPNPVEITSQKNIPVYAVKIGSIPKDIAITQLDYDKVVYAKDKVSVKVRLKNTGYEQQKVKVILKENNRKLQEKNILLPADDAQEEVVFELTPEEQGVHLYEVVIPGFPGELSQENNKREFGVEVLKSRLKVIWLGKGPSWNFKFARLELESNPQVQFDWCIKLSEGRWLSNKGIIEKDLTLDASYDVVILEDFNFPESNSFLNQGVGFILLGKVTGNLSLFTYGALFTENKFPVEIVGLDILGEKNLPPLRAIYRIKGVKMGAKVLGKVKDMPLIAKFASEKGVILGIAAKDIWRWSFYPEIKFWDKLIRFVSMHRELSQLWVETDPVYEVGSRVVFRAQAYTTDYKPDPNKEILVNVGTKEISLYSLGNGNYEGFIDFLPPGKYEYQASTPEGELAKGTFVVTSGLELQNLEPNPELLRSIAQVSGGKYIEDLEDMGIKLSPQRIKTALKPTKYPLFLLLIVVLLTIEWIYLKK